MNHCYYLIFILLISTSHLAGNQWIRSVYPAYNTFGVEQPLQIEIRLSAPLDDNSIVGSSIFVSGSQSGHHSAATPHYDPLNLSVTVIPDGPFLPAETVHVLFNGTVLDHKHQRQAVSHQWEFTIGSRPDQAQLQAGLQLTTERYPHALLALDIDEDDDADILTIHHQSNLMTVYRNSGAGFDSGESIELPGEGVAMAVQDYDRDGDSDVAVLSGSPVRLTVYSNDGSGGLTARPLLYASTLLAPHMTTADWNGDGYYDLIIAVGGRVTWLLNDRSGGFVESSTFEDQIGLQSIHSVDRDGSGAASLVCQIYDGERYWLAFLERNGSGIARFRRLENSNADAAYAFDLADVDGDMDVDLVRKAGSGSALEILLNQGEGVLAWHAEIVLPGVGEDILLADIDGDGDADIIASQAEEGMITVVENDGQGNFVLLQSLAVDENLAELVAIDLDRNGVLDLAAIAPDADKILLLDNRPGEVTERPGPAFASALSAAQVFPNPFNGRTHIMYRLDQAGNTRLTVFDLLGRRVRELRSGWLEAGEHRFEISLPGLSAGVYMYRIQHGDHIVQGRMYYVP